MDCMPASILVLSNLNIHYPDAPDFESLFTMLLCYLDYPDNASLSTVWELLHRLKQFWYVKYTMLQPVSLLKH